MSYIPKPEPTIKDSQMIHGFDPGTEEENWEWLEERVDFVRYTDSSKPDEDSFWVCTTCNTADNEPGFEVDPDSDYCSNCDGEENESFTR